MDEDLSMGSPDPGHPAFLLILCLGDQGCLPTLRYLFSVSFSI
jgi:hypothetical protein